MKRVLIKYIFILAIAYLALFLIEFYYVSFFSKVENVEYANKQFWIQNQKDLNVDFAVLGSSRADVSVDVRTIEKEINQQGINIACGGCSYKENFVLFNLFLRKNKVSNFLLVNIDEYSLNSENSFSYPFHEYYYLNYMEDEELGELITEDMSSSTKFYFKYLPGVKYIYNNNVYSVRNSTLSKYLASGGSTFTEQKGSRLRYRKLSNENKQQPRRKKHIISEEDIFYLKKLIDLAETNGIKVYFSQAPTYFETDKFQTNRDSIQRFINTFTKDQMVAVDNESINKNINYFDNYTHVNSEGAIVYSELLGKELEKAFLHKINQEHN